MEAKLREYRALRRRQELVEKTKNKIEVTKQKVKEKVIKYLIPKFFTDMDKEKTEDEVLLIENEEPPARNLPLLQPEELTEVASEASEGDTTEEENPESWRYFIIKWTIYVVIWLTLYIFFLKVGFGAVFFVVSLLIGICLNTRTRKKKKGEVSAYSVFNDNCVSIDGTLKAEQFEREIRYGAGAARIF